jgi:preprotein translocase subunit YajC
MLLPFILLIGAMFLMTRSAKKKQQQAVAMRSQMEPGSGVRTIGGLYAVVKEVHDEVVLLELTDGVHAHFAKNAIGAVLDEAEFNRIVHGIDPDEGHEDGDSVEDDAVVLDKADPAPAGTDADADGDRPPLSTLSKTEESDVTEGAPTSNGSEAK